MQQLAYAGCPLMGAQYETLLEIITRRMRCIGRWLKDTLNQRGEP
ncbi:TPA: protease FtsH-inhibitory lysogeny factor CIII [Serratia marcescens]